MSEPIGGTRVVVETRASRKPAPAGATRVPQIPQVLCLTAYKQPPTSRLCGYRYKGAPHAPLAGARAPVVLAYKPRSPAFTPTAREVLLPRVAFRFLPTKRNENE